MAESKIVVERLNCFNWSSWKYRMELILLKDQLHDMITQPKPEPTPGDWEKKDGQARAMIGLALENDQLCHVMGARTAKDMWDALKSYHERDSLTNKIHIMRRLFTMQMEEGGNLAEHLVQLSELVQRLVAMGEDLKEHWVIAVLLSSLPRSYDTLITALETRPETELKLEYIKGRLLDDWRRRCDNGDCDAGKALTVATKSTVRKKKTCYCCKRDGHFWRDCPKLDVSDEGDEREDQWKQSARMSKLRSPKHDGGGICFTVSGGDSEAVETAVLRKDRWCLDSGCVGHLTGDADLLDDMVECDEAVILADGRKVRATARGTGKLLARGNIITIRNVLFVPELIGNFLSVAQIIRRGFDVRFDSTGGHILKNDRKIADCVIKNGLYYI